MLSRDFLCGFQEHPRMFSRNLPSSSLGIFMLVSRNLHFAYLEFLLWFIYLFIYGGIFLGCFPGISQVPSKS